MSRLRITEIFYSLQGETNTVGFPTIFIRLTGCPLRCQYCDSEYAFKGGTIMSFDEILAEAKQYNCQRITVTGGEPLAQPACHDLLQLLCNENYSVSLETSGAIDVSQVDQRVVKILDIKTPGSEEHDKNHLANLDYLNTHDQIKFVICNREDYLWSKQFIEQHKLIERFQILFSPSYHQVTNKELADWIIEDQLAVRFQIQLHKYIWGDVPGK